MIQLQFRDRSGKETHVTFTSEGLVTVYCLDTVTKYSKGSPIAAMYQNLLHNSHKVGEVQPGHPIYQVVGAW